MSIYNCFPCHIPKEALLWLSLVKSGAVRFEIVQLAMYFETSFVRRGRQLLLVSFPFFFATVDIRFSAGGS